MNCPPKAFTHTAQDMNLAERNTLSGNDMYFAQLTLRIDSAQAMLIDQLAIG